ncbi:MAG: hypothetical protein JWQ11_2883 [Rhizobacter sp.]|nr:hypothetical protein [Rhizobacter sp.]
MRPHPLTMMGTQPAADLVRSLPRLDSPQSGDRIVDNLFAKAAQLKRPGQSSLICVGEPHATPAMLGIYDRLFAQARSRGFHHLALEVAPTLKTHVERELRHLDTAIRRAGGLVEHMNSLTHLQRDQAFPYVTMLLARKHGLKPIYTDHPTSDDQEVRNRTMTAAISKYTDAGHDVLSLNGSRHSNDMQHLIDERSRRMGRGPSVTSIAFLRDESHPKIRKHLVHLFREQAPRAGRSEFFIIDPAFADHLAVPSALSPAAPSRRPPALA